MPVSFEHSQGDVTHVLNIAVKPEVLQHIMLTQATSACELVVELALMFDWPCGTAARSET